MCYILCMKLDPELDQSTLFSDEWFFAHGFPVFELGFWRLVNTLYCILNILYNVMKETKRAIMIYDGFSLRGFQGNLCVLCVNVIVYFMLCLRIYVHYYT